MYDKWKNIKRYKLHVKNLWNEKKTVQQLIVKRERGEAAMVGGA